MSCDINEINSRLFIAQIIQIFLDLKLETVINACSYGDLSHVHLIDALNPFINENK